MDEIIYRMLNFVKFNVITGGCAIITLSLIPGYSAFVTHSIEWLWWCIAGSFTGLMTLSFFISLYALVSKDPYQVS